jgi:hypothetical protein
LVFSTPLRYVPLLALTCCRASFSLTSGKAFKPRGKVPAHPESSAPKFPANYEILKRIVLQVTDLKNNNNKYYSLELHEGDDGGAKKYRLYSHYGRSDDLEKNPKAGRREIRSYATLNDAKVARVCCFAGGSDDSFRAHLHRLFTRTRPHRPRATSPSSFSQATSDLTRFASLSGFIAHA